MSAAPTQCRRCVECVGQEHHYLPFEEGENEEEPFFACKHCDHKSESYECDWRQEDVPLDTTAIAGGDGNGGDFFRICCDCVDNDQGDDA